MTIKKIRKIGEDILRKKSSPVKNFKSLKLHELIRDLKDTLRNFKQKYGYGRGISAVQIGELQRVIYIKTDEFEGPIINPTISYKSKKIFWTWDSCFSADIAFFIKIKRHYEIKVNFSDENKNKQIIHAKGNLSELLQHEIDHLDGRLFTDYLIKDKKKLIMREVYENRYNKT